MQTRTTWTNPTANEIRDLLTRCRNIAVVGLSPKPHRDSHRVSLYMQQQGYTIIPVNPGHSTILGEPCHRNLTSIPSDRRIEIVNLFRRSSEVGPHVDEAIARHVEAIWMQLGVVDEAAAERARAAGILVVMDRCLMVDHGALIRR
jgi:predicted CoA-binding protein